MQKNTSTSYIINVAVDYIINVAVNHIIDARRCSVRWADPRVPLVGALSADGKPHRSGRSAKRGPGS